ncbi:bromo-adjacent homology (BAH) domain-containing protein [Wolffia australiana]
MRKRRFAQVSTSDEEEEEEAKTGLDKEKPKKARGRGASGEVETKRGRRGKAEEEEGSEGEDGSVQEDAKPVGDVVKVSGKGRKRKRHYAAFEYDGLLFELEDPVLLSPEAKNQKPYVAIIKDITQDTKGSMMVLGQWFYRPEEAERKGGGTWQTRDTRELFYSFHLDEVPAESVMHRCVVHFVPLNKQLPRRSQHPGFIVQKVYDTVERKLWKLTDKDYEDGKQEEINVLVGKTLKRLGDLPDIEVEEGSAEQDDSGKNKRHLRKKPMSQIDVTGDDNASSKSEPTSRAETPGSCSSEGSEFYLVLTNFKALTGDTYRDKWLEKIMQGVQFICNSKGNDLAADKEKSRDASAMGMNEGEATNGSPTTNSKDGEGLIWPDVAVSAVTGLEKTVHEALGSDFQKYNQKMRQLDFNLKNNPLLACRLLKKELEPSVILNMTPKELKDGWTAEEKKTQEPEPSHYIQMTDAVCSRCSEKKVGVADIIHAGGSGNRYQLECIACGHTWYASGDAISSLTIDAPSAGGNVGTAPWATVKFDAVEKKLLSPRESEKPAVDLLRKTTAAFIPVLDTQRSLGRAKNEDAAD